MSYLDDAIKNLTDGMHAAAFSFPEEYLEIEGVTDPEHVWADMEPGGALGKYIQPWKSLPDGSGLNAFMEQLTKSTSDMVKSSDIMELDDVESLAETNLSPDIPGRMSSVRENVSQWQGSFVSSFQENYTSKFDYIVFFQKNLASILRLALKANRNILAGARDDVVSVLNKTGDLLASLDCAGDGDDSKVDSAAVTAATGVLALIGGPLGVVGGVISVSSALKMAIDSSAKEHSSEYPITGTTVYEVWESMLDALQSIENDIFRSENRIAKVLDGVYDSLSDGVVIRKQSHPLHELIRPPAPKSVSQADVTKGVTDNKGDGAVEKPEWDYERPGETFPAGE